MNVIQAMDKIKKLEHQISALERAMFALDKVDCHFEYRLLKEMQSELSKEQNKLSDRLANTNLVTQPIIRESFKEN